MLWRVPRDWDGQTAFIIAGGPSVLSVDLNRLRGQRVVVVNSSYLVAPWADYLVFTDKRWWQKHRRRVQALLTGQVVTLTPMHSGLYDGLLVLERQRSGGLSDDPTRLAWWHTTLTTTLNFLALLGASRVGLLGVDGRDEDGKAWHHEPHPPKWGRNPNRYSAHREALEALVEPINKMNCQVFNLNADSAHRMFPFATLDEMLT